LAFLIIKNFQRLCLKVNKKIAFEKSVVLKILFPYLQVGKIFGGYSEGST